MGVISEAMAIETQDESEVFRVNTFNVERELHNFLQSEKSVNLSDLKCNVCLMKENCARCKHVHSPRSVDQIEETRLIDEAIECIAVPGSDGQYMFTLDYPELPGACLAEKHC